MYVGWKLKSVSILLCFASSNINTASFRFPLLKQTSYLVLIKTNIVIVTRALTTLSTVAAALATPISVAVVAQVRVVVGAVVVGAVVVANQISLRRKKFPICVVLANTVV